MGNVGDLIAFYRNQSNFFFSDDEDKGRKFVRERESKNYFLHHKRRKGTRRDQRDRQKLFQLFPLLPPCCCYYRYYC